MRKLLSYVLVFLTVVWLSLVVAQVSQAAMTCVDNGVGYAGEGRYRLSVTCTHDTTPGTAEDAVPTSLMSFINRGYIYMMRITPGATGPTDNSDLQIQDASGFDVVVAAGNGANVIDNATDTRFFLPDGATPGTDNYFVMGDGQAWTITVTNNDVNNSSWTLVMHVVTQAP